MRTCHAVLAVFAALWFARVADAQEWPSFRGPGARGVADGQDLPADWDVKTGRGVRFKTAVPGVGHSSPIVWGERVFLTTAVPARGALARARRQGRYRPRSRQAADLVAPAVPRRAGRQAALGPRGVRGRAARGASREVEPGQPDARHGRQDGGGAVRLGHARRVRRGRHQAVEHRSRHAQPRPARRPQVRVGPRELAGDLREPRDRAGRQARRLLHGRLRPADRQARLAHRARRAPGVGDPHAPHCGRPDRARGGRRLPRAWLRPTHRQGAVALQGRGGGEDADAVRGRRARDLRRRLPRAPAVRDPRGRRRRRLGSRRREERSVPRLAHGARWAVHHDAARLPRPAVRGARRRRPAASTT